MNDGLVFPLLLIGPRTSLEKTAEFL